MATTTWNSITVPAGTDLYNLAPDLKTLAESATVIVPVANTTDRAAAAAATTPSATNPLYVHRADATAGLELEVSEDGTNWTPLVGQTVVTSEFSLTAGSPIAAGGWTAVKFGRLVVLEATIAGGWAGGTWASTKILNVPTALDPVNRVATMFPYHANVAVEVRTEGGIWLQSSTGGLSAGAYNASLSWLTA